MKFYQFNHPLRSQLRSSFWREFRRDAALVVGAIGLGMMSMLPILAIVGMFAVLTFIF